MRSVGHGRIWKHTPSHHQPYWAKWWRSCRTPHARESFWAPGRPKMPWFWDLVAMSSQIPLSLPICPTCCQLFNQIPHRNLTNLNLRAWLLEPQQSRSRACLRQWQQELRLLNLTSRRSVRSVYEAGGPFYKVMYHSSGGLRPPPPPPPPPVKSVADFLMDLFQDRKLQLVVGSAA